MALPFHGVGGVTAPIPAGPIGRIMQRVLALRDLSPSKEVLQAVEVLDTLTRAEDAAARGISGELLDRVIAYLESGTNLVQGTRLAIERVRHLSPTVCDAGYC
jgi:hypothetical protein